MELSESGEEREPQQSDSCTDSGSCSGSECDLDEDFTPRGHGEDDSDTDTSDEEWNSTPAKTTPSRKRCRSSSFSSASSPLKSPAKKWVRSPRRKKNNKTATPKKGTSSPRLTPHKRNLSGKSTPLKGDEADDGERWRDIDEEDVQPPEPKFRPQRDVGPQLNRTSNYTPLDLFQLFFSRSVVDTLVRNTNAYKDKKQQVGRSAAPITEADMYSFISLVLYMGIVPLKALVDYWRGSKLFNLPFPASVMPSKRFLFILRNLHLNDPAVEAANDQKKGTPGYDRLCKIKPLYDQILEACYTFFHPHQHISIDERMVASKARISLKQYIRSKPTKWGYKLFVLADSECAYTINFFVYVGRDGEPSGKGSGYDVVMRLLKIPHLGKGYKLYVDNFYTSPRLFSDLLKRSIFSCGTLRSNVAGYPRKKKNDIPERAPRGTIRWMRKEGVLFVKWLDSREVTMCSTMHKAYSNDVVKRNVKGKDGRWAVREMPVPGCIKDYNKYMGGVDLSDALISYYNVLHKTTKWYRTFFYHFVDIATVNAFILHKEMCQLQNHPVLTQKQFREQLILSLADIGSAPNRAGPLNMIWIPSQSPCKGPHKSQNPPSHATEEVPQASKHSGHLPAYFHEHMQNVASNYRGTAGRRKCVLCKRKSPIYCRTCLKTLCLTTARNCYSEWHRDNGLCL